MSGSIRPFRETDRTAVVRLKQIMNEFHATLGDPWGGLAADADLSLAAAAEAIARDLARIAGDRGALLVAEVEDTVAGYLSWYADEGSVSFRAERRRYAYIGGISVAPSHRGQGIGTRLLAEAERQARAFGLPRLVIGVGAANPEAARLYAKLGFAPIEVRMSKLL